MKHLPGGGAPWRSRNHETESWSAECVPAVARSISVDTAPKYLIHDRDAIFNTDVVETMKAIGIKSVHTSFKNPWQNGIAERFAGCCRRDLLDHVIVLNKRHLKRLMRDYVEYLHVDRTHLSLAKETPAGRVKESNPSASCSVVALPRLDGLRHRYRPAVSERVNEFETGIF